MTNILLADHHALFRAGMVKLIESIGGFTVVGEVETAEAALEFVTENTPDVLLIEISLPSMSGFEVFRRIKRAHIGTRVVALTQCVEQPVPLQALRAGFDGYVGKDVSAEELTQALYKVRFGKRYVSEKVARDLAGHAYGDGADNPFQQLSVRELQVLLMVLGGHSPTSIGQALSLSPKTVNSYRYRIFDKLQVDGDVALTKMAIQYRVIDLGLSGELDRELKLSALSSKVPKEPKEPKEPKAPKAPKASKAGKTNTEANSETDIKHDDISS